MAACLAIAPEVSVRRASLEPVRRMFAAVLK